MIKNSCYSSLRTEVRIPAPAQKLGMGPGVLTTLAMSPAAIGSPWGFLAARLSNRCEEDTLLQGTRQRVIEEGTSSCPLNSMCVQRWAYLHPHVHIHHIHIQYIYICMHCIQTYTDKQVISLSSWCLHPSAKTKAINTNRPISLPCILL